MIAPGDYHTCALLASSGVYCWGDNFYGQLGTGDTTARLSPTAVLGLGSGEILSGFAFKFFRFSGLPTNW